MTLDYRPRPRLVSAVPWWPPGDPRHDPARTPVKHEDASCFDSDTIEVGDIGWETRSTRGGPACAACGHPSEAVKEREYWLRCSAGGIFLQPGHWIVNDLGWVDALQSAEFQQRYEPIQAALPFSEPPPEMDTIAL